MDENLSEGGDLLSEFGGTTLGQSETLEKKEFKKNRKFAIIVFGCVIWIFWALDSDSSKNDSNDLLNNNWNIEQKVTKKEAVEAVIDTTKNDTILLLQHSE